MTAHTEWASARYTQVTMAAHPGQMERGDSANEAGAIELVYGSGGDSLVITGRPEDLLAMARNVLAAAEEIVVESTRDPELRALYGMTS